MRRIKGYQFVGTHFSHFHFDLFFEKSQCRSRLLHVVRRDVLCVCKHINVFRGVSKILLGNIVLLSFKWLLVALSA